MVSFRHRSADVISSLTLIFFAPFSFISYETGYQILVGIILICYLFTTLILPRWLNPHKDTSAFAMLLFVSGLVSYGFQFELERGQWNLIAFAFSLAAIYIFHKQTKYRWLAYFLFSLSVQLKLFPAIFIFSLIDNFSDWKHNLKRIIGLGVINIIALFLFGINPVLDTIKSLQQIFPAGRIPLRSFTQFLYLILLLKTHPPSKAYRIMANRKQVAPRVGALHSFWPLFPDHLGSGLQKEHHRFQPLYLPRMFHRSMYHPLDQFRLQTLHAPGQCRNRRTRNPPVRRRQKTPPHHRVDIGFLTRLFVHVIFIYQQA